MRLNGLIIAEIIIFAVFWILILLGVVEEFNTISFFEGPFTYALIMMAILTGFLIGGLYERFNQERKRQTS